MVPPRSLASPRRFAACLTAGLTVLAACSEMQPDDAETTTQVSAVVVIPSFTARLVDCRHLGFSAPNLPVSDYNVKIKRDGGGWAEWNEHHFGGDLNWDNTFIPTSGTYSAVLTVTKKNALGQVESASAQSNTIVVPSACLGAGPGIGPIRVVGARIGCLDIQTTFNLTKMVGPACNDKLSCTFKAPTEEQYKAAGVTAATRWLCTQAMEIVFQCGQNSPQTILVPGDAWNNPPAVLSCGGTTVATNRQFFLPPLAGTGFEPQCTAPVLGPPDYFIAPSQMLDWTATFSQGDYTFIGFRPPASATTNLYNTPLEGGVTGAPGSTLGANEGRLHNDLRMAARGSHAAALCKAAQRFSDPTGGGLAMGNAFADISVTGKRMFQEFRAQPFATPNCSGTTTAGWNLALNRAYAVANALRLPHNSPERQALGWIAVSGEDDQPYRPVNVPSATSPTFDLQVQTPFAGRTITVNTRFTIIHKTPPTMTRPPGFLVDGQAANRRVPFDFTPALASNANVVLFLHGMDSRMEEALELTKALHKLPSDKNWTVVTMDMPTSGYADNINPELISPVTNVACKNTPIVDFDEEFIVAFVNTLDARLGGALKPKIKAVVGGSLGGNMAMRLGRRPNTPWVTNVVPWSPASIWPSMIAQSDAVFAGCDTGWNLFKNQSVQQALTWAGKAPRFLPQSEITPAGPELRRELFYGGFDWDAGVLVGLFEPNNAKPQASCWFTDKWSCKLPVIAGARLDCHETYNANFRAWHWRLGGEQLAFSHHLFSPGTTESLFMRNDKRMLLLCGAEDTCGDLCQHTQKVAEKMTRTPGYARFLNTTGHSLDTEHPVWVAREIDDFLR